MKEYLTMREAALLIGKTTKTIKNYIKRGRIKNFFQVEGKYGQEYKISVRDLEPLGIVFLDVLKDDFTVEGKEASVPVNSGESDGAGGTVPVEKPADGFDPAAFLSRHEEVLQELWQLRSHAQELAEENKQLRQDIEEKKMLIEVLMKKNGRG